MPTRLQITAFFFILAIGTRKIKQSFRKFEQKKTRALGAGGFACMISAGAGRAARGLRVCIVQIMRVFGLDVGTAELPERQRVICLILRRFIEKVVQP